MTKIILKRSVVRKRNWTTDNSSLTKGSPLTWDRDLRIKCSGRKISYFGLARNLIRRIISPNKDDLSYTTGSPFPSSRNWVSCQTHSLWLNNAVQCRRPIGRSLIAAAAWTHEGTYLIYGFLVSISFRPRNPSWIWIRYIQYATHWNNFMSPPKIGYVDAMPYSTLGT